MNLYSGQQSCHLLNAFAPFNFKTFEVELIGSILVDQIYF